MTMKNLKKFIGVTLVLSLIGSMGVALAKPGPVVTAHLINNTGSNFIFVTALPSSGERKIFRLVFATKSIPAKGGKGKYGLQVKALGKAGGATQRVIYSNGKGKVRCVFVLPFSMATGKLDDPDTEPFPCGGNIQVKVGPLSKTDITFTFTRKK